MKAFFIGCVVFLVLAWAFLSAEHGKSVGNELLDFLEKLFGKEEDKWNGTFPQVMDANSGLLFNLPTK